MSGKTKRQKETQAFTGNKKTWREQSRLSGCSWGGGDNAAKIDLAFLAVQDSSIGDIVRH